MKASSLLRILAASVLLAGLAGCEHGGNGLPYKEAEHYFLRNDVNGRNVPTKMTTQTEFDRYFGMAAVMGGQPTAIDFDRQFVIAIVLPETNHSTTIRPGTLTDEGGALKPGQLQAVVVRRRRVRRRGRKHLDGRAPVPARRRQALRTRKRRSPQERVEHTCHSVAAPCPETATRLHYLKTAPGLRSWGAEGGEGVHEFGVSEGFAEDAGEEGVAGVGA